MVKSRTGCFSLSSVATQVVSSSGKSDRWRWCSDNRLTSRFWLFNNERLVLKDAVAMLSWCRWIYTYLHTVIINMSDDRFRCLMKQHNKRYRYVLANVLLGGRAHILCYRRIVSVAFILIRGLFLKSPASCVALSYFGEYKIHHPERVHARKLPSEAFYRGIKLCLYHPSWLARWLVLHFQACKARYRIDQHALFAWSVGLREAAGKYCYSKAGDV